MKYQILKSINNQYYFILTARNGQIVATSELYSTKQACKKGINSVKRSLFAKTKDLTL